MPATTTRKSKRIDQTLAAEVKAERIRRAEQKELDILLLVPSGAYGKVPGRDVPDVPTTPTIAIKGANYFRNAGMSLNLTAGVDTSAAPSPSPHPPPSSGHSRTPSQTPSPYPPGSPTPTVHARGPPASEAGTMGAAGRPEDPRVGQWLANLPPAGH
ncbi:hypothetical protein JCM21900_000723 [Sporobolomyces salmonicolor]